MEIITWPGTALHIDKKIWLIDMQIGRTVSNVRKYVVCGI